MERAARAGRVDRAEGSERDMLTSEQPEAMVVASRRYSELIKMIRPRVSACGSRDQRLIPLHSRALGARWDKTSALRCARMKKLVLVLKEYRKAGVAHRPHTLVLRCVRVR